VLNDLTTRMNRRAGVAAMLSLLGLAIAPGIEANHDHKERKRKHRNRPNQPPLLGADRCSNIVVGANLAGADLSNADLSGADLSKTPSRHALQTGVQTPLSTSSGVLLAPVPAPIRPPAASLAAKSRPNCQHPVHVGEACYWSAQTTGLGSPVHWSGYLENRICALRPWPPSCRTRRHPGSFASGPNQPYRQTNFPVLLNLVKLANAPKVSTDLVSLHGYPALRVGSGSPASSTAIRRIACSVPGKTLLSTVSVREST
jgi:hypothetical protein